MRSVERGLTQVAPMLDRSASEGQRSPRLDTGRTTWPVRRHFAVVGAGLVAKRHVDSHAAPAGVPVGDGKRRAFAPLRTKETLTGRAVTSKERVQRSQRIRRHRSKTRNRRKP
jgi:hypothetical protein